MNAKEIRDARLRADHTLCCGSPPREKDAEFWLSEIAAQLAELNRRLARWDSANNDDDSSGISVSQE